MFLRSTTFSKYPQNASTKITPKPDPPEVADFRFLEPLEPQDRNNSKSSPKVTPKGSHSEAKMPKSYVQEGLDIQLASKGVAK